MTLMLVQVMKPNQRKTAGFQVTEKEHNTLQHHANLFYNPRVADQNRSPPRWILEKHYIGLLKEMRLAHILFSMLS
ncbi:MAG: hypothetical protein K0S91_716 [Nitrososphaeraceae archaeon]|jgi:hypothetical protein|nr:hypothetical protein [Nitrososphaeraceae archaeon]